MLNELMGATGPAVLEETDDSDESDIYAWVIRNLWHNMMKNGTDNVCNNAENKEFNHASHRNTYTLENSFKTMENLAQNLKSIDYLL